MTITELIQNLEKLKAKNPDCEVAFQVRDLGPEPAVFPLGFESAALGHDAEGAVCIVRLISQRTLTK